MSLFSSDHSLEDQLEDNAFYIGNERWAICPGQVFITKAILASTQVLLKTPLPELLTQEQFFSPILSVPDGFLWVELQTTSVSLSLKLPGHFATNHLLQSLSTVCFRSLEQDNFVHIHNGRTLKQQHWENWGYSLEVWSMPERVRGCWDRAVIWTGMKDAPIHCWTDPGGYSRCLLFPRETKKHTFLRTVDSLSFSEKSFLAHSIEKLEKLSFEHSPPPQQGLLK